MPKEVKSQKLKVKNQTKTVKEVKKTQVKKAEPKKVQIAKRESPVKGLSVDVLDLKGKVVEKISLPKEIFGAKVNNTLMAQAVRVYLANQRSGSASTKSRGEVRGSTRKIYRQKGTGRARHGGVRAPIFVHGGIAFGPKPRDYSLKLPQKMRKASLVSALSVKCQSGDIRVLEGLEKIEPKTKLMASVLKALNLDSSRILLVVPNKIENLKRAAGNLEKVEMSLASNLNTYQVLDNKTLVLMKQSVEAIKKFISGEATK